jgi:orotate phosphoribosyltransferase
LISRLFYEALQADRVTAVGGLTLGADPLVAGDAPAWRSAINRGVSRPAHDQGSWPRGQVEGNLAGHKRVAILDGDHERRELDHRGRGGRESYKAEVVRVPAVVDREQGARRSSSNEAARSRLFDRRLIPAER